MRNAILCALLAAAACSPPASNTTGENPQTPSAATAAAPSQIRPGRWAKVMTMMGQQTREYECITTSDLNQLANEPNSQCTSANGFQRTPEGLVYEADCTGEDGGGHMRMVMTGDMQNHYSVMSTMTGGGMNMQIQIDGTYEGACHGDE